MDKKKIIEYICSILEVHEIDYKILHQVKIVTNNNFVIWAKDNGIYFSTYGWHDAIHRIEKLQQLGYMEIDTYKEILVEVKSTKDIDKHLKIVLNCFHENEIII